MFLLYWCLLEAVLIRYNYTSYSQYDIINEFGLPIPITAKVSEKISNITRDHEFLVDGISDGLCKVHII
jgi:hypothetical protein